VPVVGKERMANCATGGTLNIDAGESLISRVRKGDQGALAEIYDCFAPIIYSITLRVLHEPSAAEDVMQEVFLHIWRNPDTYSTPEGSLHLRLALIARNRAIDRLRQRESIEIVDDIAPVTRFNFDDPAERECRLHGIRQAIRELPIVQRQMFELAFFEKLTPVEIAACTGEPINTVKTCIGSVMLSLRKLDGSTASSDVAVITTPPRVLTEEDVEPS
jgi:RNA polymerase sigma-70 factor (ECF subfamily)